MERAIRIGLLAEGEAELGASVPYILIPHEKGDNCCHRKNTDDLD